MTGNLSRRVDTLEQQATPVGRTLFCWIDQEPPHLEAGDILYRVSWQDADEDDQ